MDDAFAIAALLRSGLPVAAVASVGGNTSEAMADRNNSALGELCGYGGRYLRGVEAGDVQERIDRADLGAPLPPRHHWGTRWRRVAALWHTCRRARHGQLLLRSPGSGVRHRWLSTRRNRRPGPEEPGAFLVPGVRRPTTPEEPFR